jgi:hypothetical protein
MVEPPQHYEIWFEYNQSVLNFVHFNTVHTYLRWSLLIVILFIPFVCLAFLLVFALVCSFRLSCGRTGILAIELIFCEKCTIFVLRDFVFPLEAYVLVGLPACPSTFYFANHVFPSPSFPTHPAAFSSFAPPHLHGPSLFFRARFHVAF